MQDHASGGTVEQRRSVLTTLALGLSTFLILFDVTAVVVAMPAIAKDVGLGVAGLAWVIDAYSLAFTGALLASGALADRFGRRRCMLAGNAVFLVSSVACGMALSEPMLLAMRVVQGAGAAFMATGGTALVAIAFPTSLSGPVHSASWVIAGVAMAQGPTLGGILAACSLALDLFCKHPLLPGAGPGGATAGRRDERQGRATAGCRRHLLKIRACRRSALGRTVTGPQSRLPRGSTATAVLFIWQRWRSPRPCSIPACSRPDHGRGRRVADSPPIRLLGRAVYFRFLSAAIVWWGPVGPAGKLPMVLVAYRWPSFRDALGMASLFRIAFGLVVIGDVCLMIAALSDGPEIRLAAAVAGMAIIGVGAALANPQLSGIVWLLPRQRRRAWPRL